MNNTCPSAPANKKEYLTDIGKILVKDYGKKKYYKPEEELEILLGGYLMVYHKATSFIQKIIT